MKTRILLLTCLIIQFHTLRAQENTDQPSYIVNKIISLPLLDPHGVKVGYEGSIDKKGKNADWDWSLYQDQNGEWVIFDIDGPGCIYNIVQHRYLSSSDPVFRFYFNHESEPAFSIRLSEFGSVYPFVSPMAGSYIGPLDNGRGPIRVSRSFVPMPFQKGCKVTTDVKLEGHDRLKGEGGWGHIIYHSYTENNAIPPFHVHDDARSNHDLKKQGLTIPHTIKEKPVTYNKQIKPGEEIPLFRHSSPAVISSLRLNFREINPEIMQNIWIRIVWDNHPTPDIYCPIGAFFGNSFGFNDTNYSLMGVSRNGSMYNTFPMPFWENANISIENKSNSETTLYFAELSLTENNYPSAKSGYFKNTPFYTRKHVAGKDSPIGKATGHGKMVAAHVTCYGERPNIITCEGDVRVYIDGNRTSKVESDGSESYVCYGWGFPTPPEVHPFGGYDGLSDNPWSMTRLNINEYYPFYNELEFNIESGEHNNQYLEHSGTIFYYGKSQPVLIKTDSIDLQSNASCRKHRYRLYGKTQSETLTSAYEGTYHEIPVSGKVNHFTEESASEFTVQIDPENQGVRLRRRSDQTKGRQCAEVYIDGQRVETRDWYVADYNPFYQWLDDEFEIPSAMTKGKKSLNIRIKPKKINGEVSWNESRFDIFVYKEK